MTNKLEERRVAVASEHSTFLTQMVDQTESSDQKREMPFKTYVDLLGFAAAFGATKGKPLKFSKNAKTPSPIRYEVFERRGYGSLIDLLAVNHKENVDALNHQGQTLVDKIEIFEGYANRGLTELKEVLGDYSDKLMGIEGLIQNAAKSTSSPEDHDTDLSGIE